MHPRKGLASPRVGTYFCVRTFWPRPRVTVPNVAPGFRLPDALKEGMASRVPRTFAFQTFGLGLKYRCPCHRLALGAHPLTPTPAPIITVHSKMGDSQVPGLGPVSFSRSSQARWEDTYFVLLGYRPA